MMVGYTRAILYTSSFIKYMSSKRTHTYTHTVRTEFRKKAAYTEKIYHQNLFLLLRIFVNDDVEDEIIDDDNQTKTISYYNVFDSGLEAANMRDGSVCEYPFSLVARHEFESESQSQSESM